MTAAAVAAVQRYSGNCCATACGSSFRILRNARPAHLRFLEHKNSTSYAQTPVHNSDAIV